MPAVAGDPVGHESLLAQLRPAAPAMAAHPASLVMVAHHALADARFALADARADGCHDSAGLMPGDDRPVRCSTDGEPAALGRAIGVQVAAAHPGSLHGEHDLARTGCRIREFLDCKLA